jgi:hypothetical protein
MAYHKARNPGEEVEVWELRHGGEWLPVLALGELLYRKQKYLKNQKQFLQSWAGMKYGTQKTRRMKKTKLY